MKEDNIKIIQFSVEPYSRFDSNGSMYKTEIRTQRIFGLGDDGKVYRWGKHIPAPADTFKEQLGWILHIPN